MRASRYQQEAEQMRRVIKIADPDTCLLFNEPFTSTNPAEAAELLRDIIIGLRQKGTTMILVTHIYNVYSLLCGANIPVRSYVTGLDPDSDSRMHTYILNEKAPDGLSYARLLARECGFGIGGLPGDPGEMNALKEFMMGGSHLAQIIS